MSRKDNIVHTSQHKHIIYPVVFIMIIRSAARRWIIGDDVTVQVFQIFFQEALAPKLYEEAEGLTT